MSKILARNDPTDFEHQAMSLVAEHRLAVLEEQCFGRTPSGAVRGVALAGGEIVEGERRNPDPRVISARGWHDVGVCDLYHWAAAARS
jgi:hypothetical protein